MRLKFSILYALRNLIRDRQRTAFALFSIAAGVATVVALRMLGLMLTDALTSNVKGLLRGDIVVQSSNSGLRISFLEGQNVDRPITASMVKQIESWAESNNIDVTYSATSELMQAAVIRNGRAERPAFVMGNFIDPQRYPFYDTIRALDGTPLSKLFTGADQVVIGKRLADQLGAQVGDQIRVGTAKNFQTVQGIVPDTSESNFENPTSIMFSFLYIDRAYMEQFGLDPNTADKVYLRVPENTSLSTLSSRISKEWPRPATGSRVWRVRTAERVLQQNKFASDLLSRFVLLLSLVALVIGGVGIANTMLVSVNRRAPEIAVLKTLGIKGSGVGRLFLIEAFIVGLFGSLIGLVLGIILSFVAKQFGEQAFALALPWRINAEPLALGIVLGMIITLLFSIFPALLSAQVRPIWVLRAGGIPLARGGCLLSLLSLVLLLAGLSGVSEWILGGVTSQIPRFGNFPLPLGVIGTLTVFVLIMIILGLVWVVVWALGKLPSFYNPSLRLAIRALTLRRGRTALSLLALIIGMTALSGTLIMTRSINTLLATSITEPLGGNMIVLPLLPLTDALVRGNLDQADGVTGYRDVRFVDADLQAINGNRRFRDELIDPDDVESEFGAAQLELIIGLREHGNPPQGTLVAGRHLNAEDSGKYRIVIPYHEKWAAMEVGVGSTFTYSIRGQGERTFEVVGIVAPDPRTGFIPFSLSSTVVQAPLDSVKAVAPFDIMIANVKAEKLNDVMAVVGTVPGVFVFDISVFDSIINRLLSQMAALPLLVAILSLFAAGVLIATTVSLATIERRQQIAILKALGVTRQQTLNQLLIENAIIGLAGGIISLLPTLLIIQAIPLLTEGLVTLPIPADLVILMVALSVGITLVATLLTAWKASGEKPLVALRYE